MNLPLDESREVPDIIRTSEEGRHIACVGTASATLAPGVTSFVAEALDHGRVLWIHSHLGPERIRAALLRGGLDVEECISDGRLQFQSARDVFLRSGDFDAITALSRIGSEVAAAANPLEPGGLTVVQELPPFHHHAPEAQQMRAYEAGLNDMVSRHSLSVLCVYDSDRASEAHLVAALDEHPQLVEGSEIIANVFFSPSVDFEGWDDAEIVRRRMRMLEEHREGREAVRRHDTLVRLLQAIHEAARGAGTREEALRVVLQEVCRYTGWPEGHAYTLDAASGELERAMVWRSSFEDPDKHVEPTDAARDLLMEHSRGDPGRVVATGKAIWIADASKDPEFARARLLRKLGLHGAIGIPVRVGGRVQAVLEFFSHEPQEPDEHVLAVLEQLGSGLGEILELKRVEAELGFSESRFRALVQSAADGIVLADSSGRIVSWNQTAERMFGYSSAEILGEPLSRLMPPRHRPAQAAAFRSAAEAPEGGHVGRTLRVEGVGKDGHEFPIEISLASWTAAGNRYFSGILRDVSAREQAEEELKLLGSAIANVHDAIVVTTSGGSGKGPTILYVNPAFTKMTGFTEPEVLGRSFGVLTGTKTEQGTLRKLYRRLQRGEATSIEIIAYRRDGTEFLMDWHASPIREPDGRVRHFVSVQRDITEERLTEEALRRADRDPLTGLPNREVFVKRLQRSVERARDRSDYRYAVLFLDLDGFKRVNDAHGHIVGDQLLASATRRLERTVRPGDTIARFGGDEFVVLLEYVSGIADVMTVADRIQAHLAIPFILQGHEFVVPASIGVALSESRYEDPEDVLRDADEAMYRAKQAGKGRVEIFDAELYATVVERFRLKSDLARSIERGELEVHYQPLVMLGSGSIIGLEALVRWRHPERGLILPDEFIPVAEESGLIVPIGRWVLTEACRAMRVWDHTLTTQGPLILSVNLSVRELTSPGLVETVREVLESTRFPPSRLQLEITESVFIEQPEDARKRLEELRAMGVQVCIDDFGTGYSSLGYLHRFPVGLLKIDRLFVHQMEEKVGNGEIVRTILSLAENLGLEVLAEGVETSGQAELLRALACKYAQGFYYSQPVRHDEVARLFAGPASGEDPEPTHWQ